MSSWVGMAPAIGVGSLNGFAIGVLMSGAFFLAIIAPRRARGRRATVERSGRALANGHRPRPCGHVIAAETFGLAGRREAEPGGSVTRAEACLAFPASRAGRAGDGYRSKHRLGDPIPGRALPPTRFGSPPGSAPGDAGRRGGGPSGAQPGVAFPDGTFGTSPRPEARRLPRHAAPEVSFVTRMGHRTTGLLAARTLASGAHG